jgi:hypothetical protein
VLNGLHDLGDHDFVGGDALYFDAFDFDSGEGEELVEFLGRLALKVHMRREPVQRNVHSRDGRWKMVDGGW